jgi:hypothetical protein
MRKATALGCHYRQWRIQLLDVGHLLSIILIKPMFKTALFGSCFSKYHSNRYPE